MKKTLLIAGLLLVSLLLLMLPPTAMTAQAGCCKIRKTPRDPWKKDLDLTFERCRQLNEQKDGDDVSAESGLVWWDKECR